MTRRKKGTGGFNSDGYHMMSVGPNKKRPLHCLIAEKALGKILPKNAQVHHVDGVKSNNRNDNLVICPSRAYHVLLHKRTLALECCGHADWNKCRFCGEWDPQDIVIARKSSTYRLASHVTCQRAFWKKRYRMRLERKFDK